LSQEHLLSALDLVHALTLFRIANLKKEKLVKYRAATAFRMPYELTAQHSR
tara:strand:+ start:851 stop:1003 length:153 start_codon:yes stop_codon:yes gene_type:complete